MKHLLCACETSTLLGLISAFGQDQAISKLQSWHTVVRPDQLRHQTGQCNDFALVKKVVFNVLYSLNCCQTYQHGETGLKETGVSKIDMSTSAPINSATVRMEGCLAKIEWQDHLWPSNLCWVTASFSTQS